MQDQGLHRCPTITLSIIKLILNSFIRQCTHPPKIQRNEAKLRIPFSSTHSQHNGSTNFILLSSSVIFFIFLHTKSREGSRLFKAIICLLISRGFLLNNLLQLVQLEQLLQLVCLMQLIQQLCSYL